jgi:hypothetical protein
MQYIVALLCLCWALGVHVEGFAWRTHAHTTQTRLSSVAEHQSPKRGLIDAFEEDVPGGSCLVCPESLTPLKRVSRYYPFSMREDILISTQYGTKVRL